MTDTRVIAVGSPPTFRQQVARVMEADPDGIGWVPSVTAVEESLLAGEEYADVLVLSPGIKDPDVLGLAEFVARSSPTTAVVAVRDHAPNGFLPVAMRAGVRDVVDLSRGSQEFREAMEQAIAWSANLRVAIPREPGRDTGDQGTVISVFSSKGGTGKTFLSCNLAAAISDISGKQTALVDLDLGMGDVFTYYGREPGRPIQDLIAVGDRTEKETIMSAATQLADNLWGFGSPPDPAAQTVHGESVGKVLRAVRSTFAYTVVDSAADYSDHTLASFDLSDTIVLITGLDVVGIRHLSKAMDTLLAIGFPRERFRVVLNWADAKVGLEPERVERVMKLQVDATIPSSRLVPLCLNRGRPVYFEEPKSDVARSVASLADMLIRSPAAEEGTTPAFAFGADPRSRGVFRRR
ncbi:MAG: AAA family ATPase [Actinobacteria bacterium]|nr:AAA family ATPase [Actinomycetota bacterium]